LDPEYSEYAHFSICSRLGIPLEDQLALRTALTRHLITDKDGNSRLQTWGQLMGSPVSFPILCIVNAAISRLAMDMGGFFEPFRGHLSDRKLRDYPMLVNGDDIGFQSNGAMYDIWKWLTRMVGLRFSVGKNYTHSNFLILNSQLHRMTDRVDFFGISSFALHRIPHLQLGLLYGSTKGSSRDHLEQPNLVSCPFLVGRSLAEMAHDLISPWTPTQKDKLMGTFLRLHSHVLKDVVPRGMSWWLPVRLGGLGLPVTRRVEISYRQLQLASYLASLDVEDPDLSGLCHPDVPQFLGVYLNERARILRALGVPKKHYPLGEKVPPLSLPFLESFVLFGGDSMTEGKAQSRVLTSFYRMWKNSLKSGLRPMGVIKALAFQDRISYFPVSFSGSGSG